MPRARTHYDNLKVARDAPPEVIRAAFWALSTKFNPDMNSSPSSSDTERILRLINRAYAVLSDPKQRSAHDLWIAEFESRTAPPQRKPTAQAPRFISNAQILARKRSTADMWVMGIGAVLALFMFVGISLIATGTRPSATTEANAGHVTPETRAAPESPKPVKAPTYQRSLLAPNKKPWPYESGYLFEHEKAGGNSVLIDNAQNDSDMLVKIFDRGLKPPAAVRVFFLKAGGTFTADGLRPGPYDIRYQNLDTGKIYRSPRFPMWFILSVTQNDVPQPDGAILHKTHWENFSLTLYKVINGNTDSEMIGAEDF